MNKQEFMEYVEENFTVDGAFMRLLSNVLDHVASHSESMQYPLLCDLLDNTIGLSDAEIRRICL